MPTLERPGATLFYERRGSGPGVLLLQGVGVIGAGWTPQVEALSGRYTVVTIDNRGIGRSTLSASGLSVEEMADDAFAVAEAEGLSAFHLAGHSMGGVIAQRMALQAPERVLSLALLCTFLRGSQGAAMSAGLLVSALRARIGTRRMRRRAFAGIVMPKAYLAGVDRDALCERLGTLFGRDLAEQPPILMRQLRALAAFDASPELGRLGGIPTLVLAASEDRIARPAYGRALAAAIPGARYEEVRDAGHAVTIQRAELVNGLLLEHLERSRQLTADS